MAEWKIVYKILKIAMDREPNAWEILGVDRREKDLRKILSAFEERKRILAAGVTGQRQMVLVRKFQQEVLVPAFNKVCTEAERDDVEEIEEPEVEPEFRAVEDDVTGLTEDDDDNVYSLSAGETINADEFLKPEDKPKADDVIAEKEGLIPFLEVVEDSDNLAAIEAAEERESGEPVANDDSDDYQVPVLLDADQFVPELESSQELQALQNVMDDSRVEEQLDSYEELELVDDEPAEDVVKPKKKKLGHEKFLLYFIAIIPFIALGVFAIVLINLDPDKGGGAQAVGDGQVSEAVNEVENDGGVSGPEISGQESAEPVEAAAAEEPETGEMRLSLGVKPVEVPVRFSFLIDEVKASFSDGSSSVEVLEDIAVILKAWQIIVQNAPETGDYVLMLQNNRHRGRAYEVFDLESASMNELDELLSEPDNSIDFPIEFFQEELNSGDNARIWRAIELAGISGSASLQEFIFRELDKQKDQEQVSRMIRALCIWSSASDQMAMLDLIKPGKRDLARMIIGNLLMRYGIDPLASGAYESLLPHSFTTRDLEKTLEWWGDNLLKLSPAMPVNNMPVYGNMVTNGVQAGSEVSETSYQSSVLAVVWKNAIELSASLRSTRGMPLLSPDIEINSSATYPLSQVLFRSVKQVAEGLLAVMYDEYSTESFLEDLDILRFHALEYEFGDADMRAPYKAEEVSVYCDLIAGGEFTGKYKVEKYTDSKSPLLSVRKSLFEAMSKYASSSVADYNAKFIGDVSYYIKLDFDFELNNEYELVNESDEKLKELLEEFRSEPFSADKFNEVRAASSQADMQGKAGLAYLQLAIKALQSGNSADGGSMAIYCFRNAMKWPESSAIMKHYTPGLYESLSQNPDYHCAACGDTGYRLCPKCNGMIFVRCQECRGNGAITVRLEGRVTCPDCGGYGMVPCWDCTGAGVVSCMECFDYLTSQELFLPDEEVLKELQQEINLSTLQIKVEIKEVN